MYTILLYVILIVCVIIAFILADKKVIAEKKQKQTEDLEANQLKKEKLKDSIKEKEEKI